MKKELKHLKKFESSDTLSKINKKIKDRLGSIEYNISADKSWTLSFYEDNSEVLRLFKIWEKSINDNESLVDIKKKFQEFWDELDSAVDVGSPEDYSRFEDFEDLCDSVIELLEIIK